MTLRHALFAIVAAAMLPARVGAIEPSGYRLGPQDKLDIRVYDLRAGSGEAHQWAALNGEFFVDATGSVSLPLLGEVPAGNGTAADLANSIGSRLQNKIGLAQMPDASVQVIKYRPFYIMGAVDKPGEYDYRPGLTVLQAVSTAGGMERLGNESLLGYERDALSQRGELRLLAADQLALVIRQARLDAEVTDVDTVSFPANVKARSADPDIARALQEEQLLFDSRKNTLKSQIDAINQAKKLLTSELTSLAAKDATLSHQVDLTRKELGHVSDLVSKGLAVVPRQLAAEQSAAAYESSRLDVQLATLRAQQDLAKADRDIIDLKSNRRNEALIEATEVRAKLAADAEKMDTQQGLVYQSEVRAPVSIAANGAERQPIYLLTHRVNGTSKTSTVTDADLVEPGDVLKVLLPRRGGVAGAADRVSADLPIENTADASTSLPAGR